MYGFLADLRWFLYDMQRLLRQSWIWAHTLRVKHLKKIGDLQARCRTHCLEQGLAYEALLVSQVLGACEGYVRGRISTVVVNPAMLGMDSVRIVQDEALSALIELALQKDSFFAASGQAV